MTPLEKLYQKLTTRAILLAPEIFNPANIQVQVAIPGSDEWRQSTEIVDHGYNFRYVDDHGEVISLAPDAIDKLPTTKTVVAVQNVGGDNIVLGTFRIVTDPEVLDIFELFDMQNGFWPHAIPGNPILKPGELGRFALHPRLDEIRRKSLASKPLVDKYKRQILRCMWPFGMRLLQEAEVEVPYFVLAPAVRSFVESAGIIPEPIQGEEPSNSVAAQKIRQNFSKYWLIDPPSAYLAPREMQPYE